MHRIIVRKPGKKLIIFASIVLITGVMATAKLTARAKNSAWVDLNDTSEEYTVPDMNVRQIEASLEDVLGQYERLVNSPNQININAPADLDKLYEQSAKAYSNALALRNYSNKSGPLSDLTKSAADLTLSIFEMKDSLINKGDFGSAQLAKSRQDLASAARLIKQLRQETAHG